MCRIISCSLSPNTECEDVWTAIRALVRPWRWLTGADSTRVQKWFASYAKDRHTYFFNSGRTALLAILQSFGIGVGDEVLMQAFTCVAVPNSILWAGATPIYVDIDKTLNIDVSDLEKKYTPKAKAIIVQHTFGTPADMDVICAFARRKNMYVIEDCAHSLGAMYKGKPVGTLADASFWSFGRDKVLSSVFGGAGAIADSHKAAGITLAKIHANTPAPSKKFIVSQLLHPILFAVILPTYRIGLGKMILELSKRLRILTPPVYEEEKVGRRPSVFPATFPNALATLLTIQLAKIDRYNNRRKHVASLYKKLLVNIAGITTLPVREGAAYLRYPIFVRSPRRLWKYAKDHGVLLGTWYQKSVDPDGVCMSCVGYQGDCPKAEAAGKTILNLPALISDQSVKTVVRVITAQGGNV